MQNFKPLITLANQKTTIPVLGHVYVHNGIASATDCNFWIETQTKLPDGFYAANILKAGLQTPNRDFTEGDLPSPLELNDHILTTSNIGSYDAFKYVMQSVSQDDSHHYLRGIYVDKENLVATNGWAMSIYKHGLGIPFADNKGAIIPEIAIKYLMKIWNAKDKETPRFSIYESGVVIEHNGYKITSKLIDGNYPDYGRVIPDKTKYPYKIESNPCDFDAVSAIAKMNKTLKQNACVIENNTISNTYASYPIFENQNLPVRIGFCASLLEKILLPQCYVYFNDRPRDPILIENGYYTGVIMPMRV